MRVVVILMRAVVVGLVVTFIVGGSMVSTALAQAQDFTGLARIDMTESRIGDQRRGLVVDLALSQGVPYRVFTLQEPARLVMDFREIDWSGVRKEVLLVEGRARDVRFGVYRPGWSRMVVDLAGAFVVEEAGLRVDQESGRARLMVVLSPAPEAEFARLSGAPMDPNWDLPAPVLIGRDARVMIGQGPLIVVLDAGHGGIDPGAERGGVMEKNLMLTFAREIKETLLRAGGVEVIMTRDEDIFVALERRIAIAHSAGAHVFISLHADVLGEGQGQANGAIIHTLSDAASDAASEKLAERHDRADILAGVDLTGADDVVAGVLLDLARQETQPRSDRLAQSLVEAMRDAGGPMNRKPLRSGGFSVLKAADVVSVLIEVGFMSSPRDLKNLRNPEWRASMADGIRDALQIWAVEDAALSDLVRQ